jgi:ribosome-binding protein aMBF1 (putative translation factor)
MKDELTCEICGEKVFRKVYRLVEGVKMLVCENCTDIGEEIAHRKESQKKSYNNRDENPSTYYGFVPRSNSPPKQDYSNKIGVKPRVPGGNFPKKVKIEELELIQNYLNLLRKTRQSRNMNIKEFSNSVGIAETTYKSIEAGKMEITIPDAKKVEEKYHIKLTRTTSEGEEEEEELQNASNLQKNRDSDMTLGDVFFTRKKGKTSSDDE